MILFFLLLGVVGPALAAIPVRRSVTLWQHWSLVTICILFGISPLLLTFGGLHLAELFGCQSLVFQFTCPQQPRLGTIISLMVVAHWFAMFTIPSALVGTVALLITLIQRFKKSEHEISPRTRSRFNRSRHHKVIAGVCAAIAQRLGISLLGVRIATVALSIVITYLVVPLYLFLWLAFLLSCYTKLD
ncbi:MAG: PspC domain-containing protein [Nostocaceae cyanobacterium]|nr:PspC domain-containing protein [Nostocaceae cyanobacterium]